MTSPDWRTELKKWLAKNPKTMPESLAKIREEFIQHFPKEKIRELTLDQYALGTEQSQNSFCYWLEYRTSEMGGIGGGSVAKHSVWWSKKDLAWRYNKMYSSADDALSRLLDGIASLIALVEQGKLDDLDKVGAQKLGPNRFSMRCKPLSLYFPEQILPIANPAHLRSFLGIFGETPRGDLMSLNRQLLDAMRALPEFAGFDTVQMMHFLYDCYRPNKGMIGGDFKEFLQKFVAYSKTEKYQAEERNYKDALIKDLEAVLSEKRISSPNFLEGFAAIVKSKYDSITNLTAWIPADDLKKYISRVPEERLRDRFRGLFDEEEDLGVRIDHFKDEIDQDLEQMVEPKKKIGLAMISLFLAARYPDKYIFYRYTLIEKAVKDWGLSFPTGETGTPGPQYQEYLEFIKPIHDNLNKAFGKKVDLVDVYTFLYLNLNRKQMEGDGSGLGPEIEVPEELRNLWGLAGRTKNIILFGPPGTGKTWLAQNFVTYSLLYKIFSPQMADNYWQAVMKGKVEEVLHFKSQVAPYLTSVTFHQSFAYEDFVEGLRPLPPLEGQSSIRYEVVAGIFRKVCEQATAEWLSSGEKAPNYFLLIDEINRANIAKVFGELITLIEEDKRLGRINQVKVKLPYSTIEFGVPPNLYILGTMNSADRSIALLDLALRRRFRFFEVSPDSLLLQEVAGINLPALLDQLNLRICALLDRDHRIGHSYLMTVKDIDDLQLVWYQDIVPLIQEYFYNDYDRQHAVLGDFILKTPVTKEAQNALGDLYDPDSPGLEVVRLEGDDFADAITALCGED